MKVCHCVIKFRFEKKKKHVKYFSNERVVNVLSNPLLIKSSIQTLIHFNFTQQSNKLNLEFRNCTTLFCSTKLLETL